MNYDVYINDQFWKTLSFSEPQNMTALFAEIHAAREAGELTAFEQSDGQFGVRIVPQEVTA